MLEALGVKEMQDEISLRDILDFLWKGKFIILSITLIVMVSSVLYNLFLIKPEYEARSTVRIIENTDELKINSYTESLKNDVAINRVIEKLNLDKEKYTIESIRDSIQVSTVKGTSVIRIGVKGNEQSKIRDIANLMAFELGTRIEISDRSQVIVDAKKRVLEIEELISITQNELEEATYQLSKTPEKRVTKKSLSDEPFLLSMLNDSNTKELGVIEIYNEEINPIYTTLSSMISNASIQLKKLQTEKENINLEIAENEEKINELEKQFYTEKLHLENSERQLDGLNAVFISPAFEPSVPIGPNKMTNVIIATVMAFIISIIITFIRQYWINTNQTTNKENSVSI